MTTAKVLVVDDDEIVLRSLVEFLKTEGHRAWPARSLAEARSVIDSTPLDLVLSDVYLNDGTAFKLLETVRETHPRLPMVFITGYGTIEDAVNAIRRGASDYITKPLVDREIQLVIEQTLRRKELRSETDALRVTAQDELGIDCLVCKNPEMVQVVRMARTIANTRTNILITGESGTGKTMLARAMHYHSDRAHGPFVEVACGALTETLLEDELFGHEPGAYTGATHLKKGKFEAADRGTIFLDEIATASPGLQVKLLRVLQDACFERVGGTDTIRVDTRIILATNVDLAREVAEGRFREDLYYRINVVPIHLPPLRERSEDIPDLARHFVEKHAAELEKEVTGVSPAAMEALIGFKWPGNVRELENMIERAVVLTEHDEIELADLPPEIATGDSFAVHAPETDAVLPLKQALEEPERQIIRRALEYADGNRDRAAKLLGINRSTLFYKLRKLKVTEQPVAAAS